MTATITPPSVLDEITAKSTEIDEAKVRLSELIAECDQLVLEAVDNGEPYRDIAEAAGRSLAWVQVTLRRLGVEGPRVRRRAVRAASSAAKKEARAKSGKSPKK